MLRILRYVAGILRYILGILIVIVLIIISPFYKIPKEN